jgi:hypothetical protein
MLAGIASLARLAKAIPKISRGTKKVPILRVEAYPSKELNLKRIKEGRLDDVFTEDPKALGKWFTPNREFIKNFPGGTYGSAKLIKKIKVPESKLKEWDARKKHSYVHPREKSVIVPDEIAEQAKYSILESLPYIFSRSKSKLNKKTGEYEIIQHSDWLEILERVKELIALKRAGKKSGGIVSLVL